MTYNADVGALGNIRAFGTLGMVAQSKSLRTLHALQSLSAARTMSSAEVWSGSLAVEQSAT